MNRFGLGRLFFILFICLMAFILAAPNFLPKALKNNLAHLLPSQTLNLGLDLRGGSQLLLGVDFENYMQEQLRIIQANLKSELRDNKILYSNMKVMNNSISLFLKEESDYKNLLKIIHKLNNDLVLSIDKNFCRINFGQIAINNIRDKLIDQSIKIVRRRIDETGTKEPSIQRQGNNYILLQVPGIKNPENLKEILGKTAKLTFHLINDKVDMNSNIIPAGSIKLEIEGDGKEVNHLIIRKKIALTGERLENAAATITSDDKAVVNIKFDRLGSKQFGDLTSKNVGKYLAIVLDNKIISYARINEPIKGGDCQISGNFTAKTASNLAMLLRAGSLPAPLEIIEERTVGPKLGVDSIESGKKAFLVSLVLISLFMVCFYGIMGVFATIALITNIIIIIAILSLLQATLTMPGIAGIILTLGMAVDANVLIFERIRDELKNKVRLGFAIEKGFSQAFTTILDSNVTTILVAVLLYCFGSGTIRGFAVTLTIGIAASMFSAISLTRLMIDFWSKNKANIVISIR